MGEDILEIMADGSGLFWNNKKKDCLSVISFAWRTNPQQPIAGMETLELRMQHLGCPEIFHAAPLVHGNGEYADFNIDLRRRIFRTFQLFVQKSDIDTDSFIIDPRYKPSSEQQRALVEAHLARKFDNGLDKIANYSKIKLYYDAGQAELTKLFVNFVESNPKLELTIDQEYKNSRLFQAADYATFADKLVYKIVNKLPLTKTELQFFDQKSLKLLAKSRLRK